MAQLSNNKRSVYQHGRAARKESVDLWLAPLATFNGSQRNLANVLSCEESLRAAQLINPADRRNYILRRGLLRYILSEYTGISPVDLRFIIGRNGKPRLTGGIRGEGVYFNLSHSGGLVVYAVSSCAEIGIDIEEIKFLSGWFGLVEDHFSPAERLVLQTVPVPSRLSAFYRGWTRKEAMVKAIGRGASEGLGDIEVFLDADTTRSMFHTGQLSPKSIKWSIYDVAILDGFALALAFPAEQFSIRIGMCFPSSSAIVALCLFDNFELESSPSALVLP